MANGVRRVLDPLLTEFKDAVARLSDEQLRKLLTGEATFRISVRDKSPKRARPRAPDMVEIREDFPELRAKFRAAKTREECAVMVEYFLPEKVDMFAFAKYMHLGVQRKDGQKRIRDQIVDATAGSRIRSEIIRGGY